MFEAITSGLLGSALGGLFRLAPEILKFFDRANERKHELAMFTLQTDLEKVRGTFKVEEKYVDASVAQLTAIQEAFKQQGEADERAWQWVASVSALVRPGVTFWFVALYSAVKLATLSMAYSLNQNFRDVLVQSWGDQDFSLLCMILTFWFVGRSIEKYQK